MTDTEWFSMILTGGFVHCYALNADFVKKTQGYIGVYMQTAAWPKSMFVLHLVGTFYDYHLNSYQTSGWYSGDT